MSYTTSNSNLNTYFDGQSIIHVEQRARALQAESMANFLGGIAGAVRRFFGNIRKDMEQRRLVAELSQLDDRLLADVGLERGNLPAGLKQIERQQAAYRGTGMTGKALLFSAVAAKTPANTDEKTERHAA
ncbi:MAG: DUF1127 domain-containing protein [Pseudomonadota bacterium]